jgi:single-strand DNA-binding protein
MGNLNKVMLIGRLGKKPEVRTFSNGGKVASFSLAVDNRKKNEQTGQWDKVALWLQVKAFNRENGRKLADLVEQYLDRGHQCYVEGHLVLEEWDDKETGQKRSTLKVYMEDVQFLEPRPDGQGGGTRSAAPARAPTPAVSSGGYDESEPLPSGGGSDEEIPF